MTRPSRAKSDASQPRSPTIRKSIQLSPQHSTKLDGYRDGQLRSPNSPTIHRANKRDFFDEPLPSTPEEWIEFAQTKLRRAATGPNMSETILYLAEIEPGLLEFLISADEEIRDTVSEALCKLPWPATREAWRESIFSSLLERFRVFFNRLPPDLVNRRVDDEGRQFTYLTTALDALDHLGFSDPDELEQEEEEADPFFKFKSTSQKRRKASLSIANRARRNTAAVDPRVFKAVDVEFPATLKDAIDIQSDLLLRLQEVLEVFLASFANPQLAEHAKALFLKEPVESIIELLPLKSVPATITETPLDTLTFASDPGEFAHIRPLAAAKYFDEEPTLGTWRIIVAGSAVADLRRMRKRESHTFDLVHKKITELSEGQFSEDNQKQLEALGAEVPIYEAKVSRDTRIVYQIDLETDVATGIDRQIIKIYGIYTHAQLNTRTWSQISRHLSTRGKGYLERCLYRSTHFPQGQTVTTPAYFKHQDEVHSKKLVELPPYKAQSQHKPSDDELNLHSLLTLEKYIPMSQSLITAILDGVDTNHLFQPSAKEKEIIYHDSACCVLGRSGTGKTTCIVFKILGIELLFQSMTEFARPRQAFVTQSRVLAQRVQEYYQKLVKSSFDTLTDSQSDTNEEQVLADLEDEDASAFGLPPKYSMLEDHHFPLFVSFDQLCSLLEADFGIHFGPTIGPKVPATGPEHVDVIPKSKHGDETDEVDSNIFSPSDFATEALEDERTKKAKQAMITFDKFLIAYWPRFDERLRKGLDPALVYSELLGVIEGSEAALRTKSGALSREEYTRGSLKRTSFGSERNRIYDLYEAYRKRRGQLWNYDAAERTHALVKATKSGVPGKKFDCLYIDEAQDNLLVDIKLLHNLSNNPHGLFMAGDTAQTISAGSSFRFEDLKAFMWRLEEQDEAVRRRKRGAIHPALFHLAINYRSHGGIVDCASSVVELISDLFPEFIDKLDKETGLLNGPLPVFFSGWERGVVRFEQFLRGGSNIRIDFGASQAILVRNEAARTALREQMGEIGLILTLYESKGLEFDDVLLYNFFEDSLPSASIWRIVLAGIGPAPNFDELRHSAICAELKHLYVGLTRARKHCWIWDVSDKAEPMKTFWTHHNLVSHCGPEDPIPQLGVSSSQEAWAERGRSLFNKQLYSQAAFCFDKAELTVERDIAAAYESRKQARLLQAATSTNQAAQTFLSTATAFMECAKRSAKRQQLTCYMRAAECYVESGAWKSAAEAFLHAGKFGLAAQNYRRAGCFDEAVDIVKRHRNQMEEAVAEEVIGVAKLEYLRTDKFERAEELFENVEEQLEYMGDYGFNAAQIRVLESEHRYGEAAEVAFGEHNIMEGINMLLRSKDPKLARQAVERVLHSLWTLLPLGPLGRKLENTVVLQLIQHLQRVETVLTKDEIDQLEVFHALYSRNPIRIITLAQSHGATAMQLDTQPPDSLASSHSLVCFSCSSDLLVPTVDWTIPGLVGKLKLAFGYFSQLLRLARSLDLSSSRTRKLLGFEPRETNTKDADDTKITVTEFWIHSTSLMFRGVQLIPGAHASVPSDLGLSSLAASEVDTHRLAKTVLYNTLRSQIRETALNESLEYSIYFHPCLSYTILAHCSKDGCKDQHINIFTISDDERQGRFNLRTQALIALLEIVQIYPPIDVTESWVSRRMWTRQAYELLMPYFPPSGGLLCHEQIRVPEKGRGFSLISFWCEDALHYIDPLFGPAVMSDILICLDLAFRIDRSSTKFEAYVDRLHSSRLVNERPELMWRAPSHPYLEHSIVHDFIDFYTRKSNTVLMRMARAMHHVVIGKLVIEANVLVQVLESITREVIVHHRQWTRGPQADGKVLLDQMLVPRSWAIDLIARPMLTLQGKFALSKFQETLYQAIELLHAHEPDSSNVLIRFNGPLDRLTCAVLIMRICRMLIIFAVNTDLPIPDREMMRYQVGRLLSHPGNLHVSYTGFARPNSWIDFQNALVYSPLNRGAEELVFLSLRRDFISPPFIPNIRTITYANVFPELKQQLSLNATMHRPGAQLNPLAKTFVPSSAVLAASSQPSGGTSSEDNLRAPPLNLEARRAPTFSQVLMGAKKKIIYREYSPQKAQEAGRVIWAHYSRYRLRQAPQTATNDTIRKLHNEYMRDVERIVYPPLPTKDFYMHKRIVLGCMPHVIIYLLGLEEVNRQERDTKKKELVTAEHEYLEKLQSRINACGVFAKKIANLIKSVSPGSSLLTHIDNLRARVKLVVDARNTIMHGFGKEAIPADLEQHYALGVLPMLAPVAPEPSTSDLGGVCG